MSVLIDILQILTLLSLIVILGGFLLWVLGFIIYATVILLADGIGWWRNRRSDE